MLIPKLLITFMLWSNIAAQFPIPDVYGPAIAPGFGGTCCCTTPPLSSPTLMAPQSPMILQPLPLPLPQPLSPSLPPPPLPLSQSSKF